MGAIVVACGKWAEVEVEEVPVEKVREAVKAGAVFETLIAPVVRECVWGEIEWRGGVIDSEKGLAEQYVMFKTIKRE
mgnify:CR=1 FL=1